MEFLRWIDGTESDSDISSISNSKYFCSSIIGCKSRGSIGSIDIEPSCSLCPIDLEPTCFDSTIDIQFLTWNRYSDTDISCICIIDSCSTCSPESNSRSSTTDSSVYIRLGSKMSPSSRSCSRNSSCNSESSSHSNIPSCNIKNSGIVEIEIDRSSTISPTEIRSSESCIIIHSIVSVVPSST